MKNYRYLIGCLFLTPFLAHSQSFDDKKIIASQSNNQANAELMIELKKDDYERKLRLNNFFYKNSNYLKKVKFGEFGLSELIDVLPNGEKIFAKTTNAGAALTARANHLYSGGSLGINIQGQNMTAGVWDGGNVLNTHQEFMVGSNSKITLVDGATYEDHPTHVAGTIAAQGISPLVRGVAFNSNIKSYDWNSDLVEMLSEASSGLLVSNHSYALGQLGSMWYYGAYDSRARQIDQICFNNPFYLPVFAAGNERNNTTPPGSTQIANKAGYDMIFGHGNAKNVITVAAVAQVNPYTGSSSVLMAPFSSWGPSDDGRIKPDISTKGLAVRSTISTSDTATGIEQGTSMAAPGITGVVLLLQQYHKQLYNTYMKAATVKGLILHTADEAGQYNGPDYEFGWGLVNAQKAAIAIRDKNNTLVPKSIIEEVNLSNNATFTKTITSVSNTPLKVSISWTDPQASTQNSGTIDPSVIYLVNDLDLKVTKDDTTHYPWKLQGMALPYESATNNSTNNVDNFERVDINNPTGTYTITVTHKGTLSGGNQNFSLIVTGDNLSTLSTNEVIKNNENTVTFYPNPVKDFITIDEKDKNLLVNVYDMSGKLILSTTLIENKMNLSALQRGNYIASFITKNGITKNFKFTKE
ncbi:S8 family serine peptidase [Chryseobacterium binzhouense]|uniref:S8 family serine peptidase n=1 Tax=Chryseobacterium binzhouense TaxID=2593646 RepID=UPI0028A04F69|nr:S8 family serine peptidase [Chryseobacterium binzhouense]